MKPRESHRLQLEELERREVPTALGPDPVCHKINTTIEGHLTGPTSTAGVIQSGLLRGTTAFSGTFIDAQGDYVGTLVITTKHGKLTLQDQGNLNFATGQFTDHLTVAGGTERFAGATGELFDQGTLDLQTGSFADTSLTGLICLQHEQGG
jgi:hypothetical protein